MHTTGLSHPSLLPAETPTLVNVISALRICRNRKALSSAHSLHTLLCTLGLDAHPCLGSHLVTTFAGCGSLQYAIRVFSKIPHRLEEAWTSLLQGCLESEGSHNIFHLYTKMQEENVPSSRYTFVPLLAACTRLNCLDKGREVHQEIIKGGFEQDTFLCNALVSLYSKCGVLADCHELFNTLKSPDVVSWTALFIGYLNWGLLDNALNCLEDMEHEGVIPDCITYASGFKTCVNVRDPIFGQKLHLHISKVGIIMDISLGNSVVDMYAKCGLLDEAKHAFDNVQYRDVITWTALISGHADHGLIDEALGYFEQMNVDGIAQDAVVLATALKACGSAKDTASKGQYIHANIAKLGFEAFPFIGSTLVGFYCKYNMFTDAKNVLCMFSYRDTVSWNAIISGYIENGFSAEALKCFRQMQVDSIPQDNVTYFSSLKACSDVGDLQKGKEVHIQIVNKGFGEDSTIGNMLVYMYAKCGSFLEAQELFEKFLVKDVASWTSLIGGYIDYGYNEEALFLFKQMQTEGISEDNFSIYLLLKLSASMQALLRGQSMHTAIVNKGYDKHVVLGNAVVDMYARCGLVIDAQEILDKLSFQDITSWNVLIEEYVGKGLYNEAMKCLQKMEVQNVAPNACTFVAILKSLSSRQHVDGLLLYSSVMKRGLENDSSVINALLEMYATCMPWRATLDILHKMPIIDSASWNILIEQGPLEEALDALQCMLSKGLSPSLTALISTYAEQGETRKAFRSYRMMLEQGSMPDIDTLLSLVKACGSSGTLATGKRIHAQVAQQKIFGIDLATALIDMYGKCGSMVDAQELFDMVATNDIVVWDALVRGYSHQGDNLAAFHLLTQLMQTGVQLDDVIFLEALTLCMHVGLLEEGHGYFKIMMKDYGIIPSIKHFACVIGLFARAGRINEAVRLMDEVPFHPNHVILHTILGACKKCCHVEHGQNVFQHAVEMDRGHTISFILMCNIYVDAQMWTKVNEIEAMRNQTWEAFLE